MGPAAPGPGGSESCYLPFGAYGGAGASGEWTGLLVRADDPGVTEQQGQQQGQKGQQQGQRQGQQGQQGQQQGQQRTSSQVRGGAVRVGAGRADRA
jgi:hypothetical protein